MGGPRNWKTCLTFSSLFLIKEPITLQHLTSPPQTICYCHNLPGQRQDKSPPASYRHQWWKPENRTFPIIVSNPDQTRASDRSAQIYGCAPNPLPENYHEPMTWLHVLLHSFHQSGTNKSAFLRVSGSDAVRVAPVRNPEHVPVHGYIKRRKMFISWKTTL